MPSPTAPDGWRPPPPGGGDPSAWRGPPPPARQGQKYLFRGFSPWRGAGKGTRKKFFQNVLKKF